MGRRPSRSAALVGLVVAAIAGVAIVSALTGRDGTLADPPPLPEETGTTAATTADAALAAAPVGALDLLPGVPADRARDAIVVYDSRCDAYMLHLDRPRRLLLVDLPVPGSCATAWSTDGAYAVDGRDGLVLRDRALRLDRRLLPQGTFQRGSATVGRDGTVLACGDDDTPVIVRRNGRATSPPGVCPVGRIAGSTVIAVTPTGPLRRIDGGRVASALPEEGEIVAIGGSPRGRLHAVLGNDGGSAWLRVLAPSGLPVAAIDLADEVAVRGMPVQPRVEVADDGRLAVATVRQRAHVLRLGRDRLDLHALGAEPFLDATISPDGRSIAVATGRRVVVLDAATLDPVGQVPMEAFRVVWLDRATLG